MDEMQDDMKLVLMQRQISEVSDRANRLSALVAEFKQPVTVLQGDVEALQAAVEAVTEAAQRNQDQIQALSQELGRLSHETANLAQLTRVYGGAGYGGSD